jgi:TraM recognition site of TraD and TraG
MPILWSAPGGRLDPPLGLLLDEVANIDPLPQLPALMSFVGASGIFVADSAVPPSSAIGPRSESRTT